MLIMRRQAGGIKDPELIEPTYQPRHAGSGDLDAIALHEEVDGGHGRVETRRIWTTEWTH